MEVFEPRPLAGGVAVNGVTDAKNAVLGQFLRVHLVHRPCVDRLYLDLDGVVAD